jgi:uncharacterized membrane protein YkvA (DUF1232 family)
MAKKFTLMQKFTAALIAGTGILISLAYLTNKVDFIPDLLGFYGYADDAILILFIVIFIRKVYQKISGNADIFEAVKSIPFGE